MPDDSTFAASSVDQVRELSAMSAEHVARLRDQLAEAEARLQFWSELAGFTEKDWPIHVCQLVEADADLLRRMRAEGDQAVPLLETLYRDAKDRSRRNIAAFPAHMERAAKAAGLPLNMEQSRHPEYYFHGRYFKLRVDDSKRRARLSTSEGDLGAAIPADVGAVLEKVASEERRVFGRKVVARPFMAVLRKAYMAEVKAAGESVGASIPIRRVMKRLQRAQRGFRRDEFLADLGRLVHEDRTAIDGYVMDLQQIKSPSEGVLLPGLEDRGYVGYIIFRKG